MGPSFDPYYKWLGIPPEEQPPNHYRLLGVRDFETDPDVIQAAADQRMAHLRTYQTSQYAEWSQRLLNEVAAAKIRLLNPAKKPAYDRQLRETMLPKPSAAQPPEPAVTPDPSFAIMVDEPRLRTSYSLHPKRRLSVGAIIGGVLAMSAVVAVGLAYWSVASHEAPAVAAKQNGQSMGRNDQTGAEVKKPRTDGGATKEKLGNRSVPRKSEKDKPLRLVAPPSSDSIAAAVPSPRKPSPATLLLGPGSRSQQTKTVAPDPANGASSVSGQGKLKSQLPDRVGVPAAAAQEEALKLVHDLYKDEFAKAKTTEEKQALAKKLLAQAEAATSADAGTFVLLRLARDISAQASNGETAFAAVDAMSERYLIDALEMKAEMLFTCAKKARTPPQHLSVAEQVARLLDEATAAGNYAQAVNLVKLAVAEGGLSRSKEIVLWAKACLPDLQKKAKLATEFEAARSTLAADPNDPAANLTAGTYYGYLQGDWVKALPHLAKGTDANLQTLAQRELGSPPTDIDTRVALADAWWDAGQNAEGMKRLAMLRHAGSWYAKAQTKTLSGLSKVKVEKRLGELVKAEREADVAGPGPRVFVPLGKWFSLLTSPNEPTGWEVGECRFSYSNGVIDLRGREMYCPIVAKDATIRATVKRRNASCIRLFLRNPHEGCYFAQLTSGSWSIVKATRNPHGANQAAARMRLWEKTDTLSTIRVTRNYNELVFEMAFAAAGDTLTIFMNRQPLLQAKDAAFTEGTVGIGTDNTTELFVTNIELLIPNKGSLVGDYRASAGAAKP